MAMLADRTGMSGRGLAYLFLLLLHLPRLSFAQAAAFDADRSCAEIVQANLAAKERFARKQRIAPKDVFPIFDSRPTRGARGQVLQNRVDEALTRCHKTPQGLVVLSVRAITGCLSEGCAKGQEVDVQTDILFLNGTRRFRAPMLTMHIVPTVEETLYEIKGAYDYDGDGLPEVLIAKHSWELAEMSGTSLSLHSMKSGKLVRYPQSPPLHNDARLADADGDGRPDIYSPGPYAQVDGIDCGTGGSTAVVPSVFVYHSLPDGSFSPSDAVAQASLSKWCAAAPAPSVSKARVQAAATKEPLGSLLVRGVICARAQGKSVAVVQKALAAECQTFEESGDWNRDNQFVVCGHIAPPKNACPGWLRELISINPPVRLGPAPRN